jgi:hypothetical protein
MKSLYRAALAAGAVLATALSTASASSVIVAGFYEDNATANCPSSSNCVAVFSPIPAGRIVVVGWVNCVIVAGGGATISTITGNLSALQNFKPTARAQYLLLARLHPSESSFFLNNEVDMLFRPASRPGIQILINVTPTVHKMKCQITGRALN